MMLESVAREAALGWFKALGNQHLPGPDVACDGTILNSVDPDGQLRGIEHYPECDYAASTHYVFEMDELVRYIKFRDALVTETKRGPTA